MHRVDPNPVAVAFLRGRHGRVLVALVRKTERLKSLSHLLLYPYRCAGTMTAAP